MPSLRSLSRAAHLLTTPLAPEDFLRLVNPLASRRQLRGVVTAVIPETADSATIRFRPGKGWQAHKAGQWVRVGVEIDGVRQWRSYSLTTADGQDPAITVTAIGRVSQVLVRDVKPGDVLFLAPPQGDFVLPEHPRPLLMITAGSGLTPVMSMIRTLFSRRGDADVVLLHSARTKEASLFGEELAQLDAEHDGLTVRHWFTGEQGRRIDLTSTGDLDELCPDWRERAAYVCGPADMLDAAVQLWHDADATHHLTIERFTPVIAAGSGDGGLVTFEKSDKEIEADGDLTLLEAAETAGVVMPSGCRMGICHTCVTPLLGGKVRDIRTGEVHGEEGQVVQTCVSAAAGPVHLDI